jgi:hypothetical protein
MSVIANSEAKEKYYKLKSKINTAETIISGYVNELEMKLVFMQDIIEDLTGKSIQEVINERLYH